MHSTLRAAFSPADLTLSWQDAQCRLLLVSSNLRSQRPHSGQDFPHCSLGPGLSLVPKETTRSHPPPPCRCPTFIRWLDHQIKHWLAS